MKTLRLVGFIALLAFAVRFGEAAELRVGVAQADITPENGIPLAGYYSERGAVGTHDPLHAKAIVLEAGGVKAALVALDLIGTQKSFVEEARRIIEKECGIPAGNILISATHCHTGPIFAGSRRYDSGSEGNAKAEAYTKKLPVLIAAAVREANSKLAIADASFSTTTEENLAFNRRFHMRDGSVGWNPGKLNPNIIHPAGPTDPEVQVVYFAGTNASPLATFVNFPMHLDTVGGQEFSSDYPFVLSETLKRVKGPEMLTVFTIGCAGDVNHVNVNWKDRQHGQDEAARIGTILAADVLRAYPKLQLVTNPVLRIRSEKIRLPLAPITYDDLDKARKVVERMRLKSKPLPKFLEQVQAYKVLDVQDQEGTPLEVEVQVIALGSELAWVSLPGEIFVELGLSIKHGSPFTQTIIAELANGAIGYIPTRRAYSEGNYEVISARCAEGSGEMLVESALRQLRKLYKEGIVSSTAN